MMRCYMDPDNPCTDCGYCKEEAEEEFYGTGYCHTPGCIMTGAHFESECHTAEDLEEYYEELEEEEI